MIIVLFAILISFNYSSLLFYVTLERIIIILY